MNIPLPWEDALDLAAKEITRVKKILEMALYSVDLRLGKCRPFSIIHRAKYIAF